MIKVAAGIYIKTAASFWGTRLFSPKRALSYVNKVVSKVEDNPDLLQSYSRTSGLTGPELLNKVQQVTVRKAMNPDVLGVTHPTTGLALVKKNPLVAALGKFLDPEDLAALPSRRTAIAHEVFHAGPEKAWYRSIPGVSTVERHIRSSEPIAYSLSGFIGAPKGSSIRERLRYAASELGRYKTEA